MQQEGIHAISVAQSHAPFEISVGWDQGNAIHGHTPALYTEYSYVGTRSKGAPFQLRLKVQEVPALETTSFRLPFTAFDDQSTSRPGKGSDFARLSALPAARKLLPSHSRFPSQCRDRLRLRAIHSCVCHNHTLLPSKARGAAQESSGERIRKDVLIPCLLRP